MNPQEMWTGVSEGHSWYSVVVIRTRLWDWVWENRETGGPQAAYLGFWPAYSSYSKTLSPLKNRLSFSLEYPITATGV